RQRGDLRKHPRRHPMHTDTVVNLVGGRSTARGVGGDDEGLVSASAEMLDHPKHRVGDAVDIRKERLCDDCNAHTKSVPSVPVAEVALGHTTRKLLVQMIGRSAEPISSRVRTTKGG